MILRSCLLGGTLLLSARLASGADSVPALVPTPTSGAAPPAGLTPFATSTHQYAQGIPTGQAIRGDYGGELRPRVHYSPPVGYLSDPNGLFKDDNGTWHVYYQYNPSAPLPGLGNWGHATSPDLYAWTNAPIALHPPASDTGIGNGSVVLDANNTSGLGSVVAFYTLNSTVALAGSTDGGYTFTPAGTVNVRGRDPRVTRVGSDWVLAVARDSRVAFYTSGDLKSWSYASDFAGSGRLAAPSLAKVGDSYLLIVTTTDAPLGGETQVYYVGEFAGGAFTPSAGPTPVEWGKDASGGIVDPSGGVAISWANNVQYAARVPTAGESWRGALTLPRAVSLVKGASGTTTLSLAPYGLDAARGDQLASAHGDGQWKWDAGLNASATGTVLLEINVTAGATLNYTFSGGGSVSGGVSASELWIDRGTANGFNSTSFTPRLATPWTQRNATLLVVLDRSVLEVFVDGTAATAVFYPSSPLTHLELAANGAVSAALWDLHGGFEGDGTGGAVRRRWRKRGTRGPGGGVAGG
ncbi:Extracellular exo-inulinase [Vanrija pseudolonga]|uniref:Extracellular exo-inulinase n=1 Tax=Vanrija pseudolonga TaxID=143232 RepID=A0AAF1BPA3_9TREE|nr:Extracellular exo-inulinase [Vanrija pseudolonga]